MRKLIIWLVVVAFGVTLFAPQVSAISPDPNWQPPWIDKGVKQEGDEGGWGVPVDNSKDTSLKPLPILGVRFVYLFERFFIIKVIDNSESQDRYDTNNLTELSDSRRSNPQ
jgi:hypothetical protein